MQIWNYSQPVLHGNPATVNRIGWIVSATCRNGLAINVALGCAGKYARALVTLVLMP